MGAYKRSAQEFPDSSDGTAWRRESSDEIHRALAPLIDKTRSKMVRGDVVSIRDGASRVLQVAYAREPIATVHGRTPQSEVSEILSQKIRDDDDSIALFSAFGRVLTACANEVETLLLDPVQGDHRHPLHALMHIQALLATSVQGRQALQLVALMGRVLAAMNDRHETAAGSLDGLTTRQRQVMDLVLAGHPNKNIAADLAISQRTVENHRAAIMRKVGVKSLPELTRLAMNYV